MNLEAGTYSSCEGTVNSVDSCECYLDGTVKMNHLWVNIHIIWGECGIYLCWVGVGKGDAHYINHSLK
jgi:hypothetical protein